MNSISEVIAQFVTDCQALGLIISESQIIADGRLRRCPVIQSKHSKTSGAYFLFARDQNDYPFNGYIHNFNTGEILRKWSFKEKGIQNTIISNHLTKDYNEFHLSLEELYLKTAYVAYQIYQKSNKYPSSYTYLDRKSVKAFGVVFREFNGEKDIVTIPARDINGKIWTLQSISLTRGKSFLKNGKKAGMFHKVGFVDLPNNYNKQIIIAEGYATAASLFMATGIPAICAFDSGNLAPVAAIIKQNWSEAKLILSADLDYVGIRKALEAVTLVNGCITIPDFSIVNKESRNSACNDFNDLHNLASLEIVNNQISIQMNSMNLIVSQAYEVFKNRLPLDSIPSNFHSLAQEIIISYYVLDEARLINSIQDFKEQLNQINALHIKYQNAVKNELYKLQAWNLYHKKTAKVNPYFKEEINNYIHSTILKQDAERICTISTLEERRKELLRINQDFHEPLKAEIRLYWQRNKK